jgi:hypothetical protein
LPIHTLDRLAVRKELNRRGWRADKFGGWLRPSGITHEQAEIDWMESIICGIDCEHEKRIAENLRLQREEKKRKHLIRGGDLDSSGQ